jgi:hypothetical protein
MRTAFQPMLNSGRLVAAARSTSPAMECLIPVFEAMLSAHRARKVPATMITIASEMNVKATVIKRNSGVPDVCHLPKVVLETVSIVQIPRDIIAARRSRAANDGLGMLHQVGSARTETWRFGGSRALTERNPDGVRRCRMFSRHRDDFQRCSRASENSIRKKALWGTPRSISTGALKGSSSAPSERLQPDEQGFRESTAFYSTARWLRRRQGIVENRFQSLNGNPTRE